MFLIFIVNGEDVEVSTDSEASLEWIRDKALRLSHNTGRPPGDWEVRDLDGQLIEDLSKTVSELGLISGARFFLTLRVGAGGDE